jgi:hypothetical protein
MLLPADRKTFDKWLVGEAFGRERDDGLHRCAYGCSLAAE